MVAIKIETSLEGIEHLSKAFKEIQHLSEEQGKDQRVDREKTAGSISTFYHLWTHRSFTLISWKPMDHRNVYLREFCG